MSEERTRFHLNRRVIYAICFISSLSTALTFTVISFSFETVGSSGGGGSSSCPTSPASPCLTQVQTGQTSCTLNAGSNNCATTTGSYSPAYSIKPWLKPWINSTVSNIKLSVTVPTSQTDFAFQSTDYGATGAGTVWTSMPAATTELYGLIDMRLQWTNNFVISGNPTAWFCVNVDIESTSSTAVLDVQYSSDGGTTWNEFSPAVTAPVGGSITFPQCNSYTITTFPGVNISWLLRVVGKNGNGAGDNPGFGNIQFYVLASQTITAGLFCLALISTNTATSYKFTVSCDGASLNTIPVSIDWIAGIKA